MYSRYTTSFLDLTYLSRTLFYDTTDQTLFHFILVTARNVVTLVQLVCKGNAWSSCFHIIIVMILCFFNNIMQASLLNFTLLRLMEVPKSAKNNIKVFKISTDVNFMTT